MKDPVGVMLMKWRNRVVLPYLKGDVLDVGCGTNSLLRAYKSLSPGTRSVGVDVYPWEGVDATIASSSSLPFEDNSFDTVCCIAALNHIPEREEFLREARRLLRNNGRLIVTMIPPEISRVWHFLRSPWDADQHERGMGEGEVYGITRRQMTHLLDAAGFANVESARFMLGVNRLYAAQAKTIS